MEELFVKLREAGISDLGQIEHAYLEPSGHVSIFRYAGEYRPTSHSILPHES